MAAQAGSSLIESTLQFYIAAMVFRLAISFISLAAFAGAANVKRVTCPDGNVTSHAAVRYFILVYTNVDSYTCDTS